jgi:hypothetical protein
LEYIAGVMSFMELELELGRKPVRLKVAFSTIGGLADAAVPSAFTRFKNKPILSAVDNCNPATRASRTRERYG